MQLTDHTEIIFKLRKGETLSETCIGLLGAPGPGQTIRHAYKPMHWEGNPQEDRPDKWRPI